MADVWLHRWRIAGVNFEGRRWHVSSPIWALANEIGPVWPDNHPLDGTSASSSHATNSDHYPDDGGVVRAIDVGELIEGQGSTLFEELRASKDPRLKYVIHEAELFSSYVGPNGEPPWEPRPYRGGSEHLSHVHVSVWAAADTDGSPWELRLETDTMTPDQEAKLDAALSAIAAVPAEVWRHGHDPETGRPPSPFQYLLRTKANTDRILSELGAVVDEAEIAALILETLTPAAIARAAVDGGVGEAVLDALRAELND